MSSASENEVGSSGFSRPEPPEGGTTNIYRPRLGLLLGELGPLLALALVFGFFAAADGVKSRLEQRPGTFATAHNVRTILVQAAPVAVAALGMTVIIIAGGIDLSAGTALALAATVMAWVLREGYSPTAAVTAAIATGGAAGLLNGLLISRLNVVPFIVTLGTMTMFLGIGKILARETNIRPLPDQVPHWIPALTRPTPEPQWLLIAPGVWLLGLLALMLSGLLRYSVFSRHVFAIGSNEATARLCGIDVPRTKMLVYMLAGLLLGAAGIYQFARLSQGNPMSGLGMELRIIAAVVIGGGSLSGGRGTVLGTLTGAAIMQTIASGTTQLGITNPWQDIILGVIIVAAVTIDQFRQRRLSSS
jgi:ribose transport system permease protein